MITYIGLGFFDALSVLLLMFALYRFPVMEYKWNVIVMAGIIATISYINRVVIEIPQFDPLIQIGLFVLFLRFKIQVKMKFATLIPTSAFAAYIFIQAAIFNVLISTGIINEADVAKTAGFGTYIIQISSILSVYLISFVMKYFRYGFSFIPRPPHNLGSKDRHSFLAMWPAIILSLIGIAVSINALMGLNILLVVTLGFIMFSLLYYLSYRRDKQERDRIYRTANFRKNK